MIVTARCKHPVLHVRTCAPSEPSKFVSLPARTHLFAFAAPLDARLPTTAAGAHVMFVVVTCSVAIPTPASGITAPRSLPHKRHPVQWSVSHSIMLQCESNMDKHSAVLKHGKKNPQRWRACQCLWSCGRHGVRSLAPSHPRNFFLVPALCSLWAVADLATVIGMQMQLHNMHCCNACGVECGARGGRWSCDPLARGRSDTRTVTFTVPLLILKRSLHLHVAPLHAARVRPSIAPDAEQHASSVCPCLPYTATHS
jgi:hypothetical protein